MSDTTNRNGPHPTRIDEAIDRAVREIMHREPPPGLRRRVLSRLEAPAPRAWLAPRIAFAAAAVLVAAMATFVMLRSDRTTDSPRHEIAAAPASTPAAPSIDRSTQPQPAGVERSSPRPSQPRRIAQPAAVPSAGAASAPRATAPAIAGPPQGRVTATSLPDASAGPAVTRTVPAAPAVPELPQSAGLPPLPEIQIVPIRIDAIPVPPIIVK